MSSEKQSKIDIWWNSPGVKRFTGAAYSLGAAVVIIGALFKIMHWPGAGIMLSAGMFTEALLFALGILDKPHKDYEWDKVFAFDGASSGIGMSGAVSASGTQMSTSGKLNEEETASLSEGIKNLSETAKQLNAAMGSTKDFAKNIESASDAAVKFATVQDSLNNATGNLFTSYESLNTDMNSVVAGTKEYAGKVLDINKNLSSLNSVYEIQLKNIQTQTEAVDIQVQSTKLITDVQNEILAENKKIQELTKLAVEDANKYKVASAELANQITDLNKVYGNMLNALN